MKVFLIAILLVAGTPAFSGPAPAATQPEAQVPEVPEAPATSPKQQPPVHLLNGTAAPEQVQVETVEKIDYKDGLLTAKIENMSLGDVIAQIARKAGFIVEVSSAVSGRKITTQFEQVDLETALRRILKLAGDINYQMDYDSKGNVSTMRVYQEGKAANSVQPVTTVQGRRPLRTAPVTRAPQPQNIPPELLEEDNGSYDSSAEEPDYTPPARTRR